MSGAVRVLRHEEDFPKLATFTQSPWWWIRLSAILISGIAGFLVVVPLPTLPNSIGLLVPATLFILATTYPVLTAYFATKISSYGEIRWDRPTWRTNPFRAEGPLHLPHFFFPMLIVSGYATGLRVYVDWPASGVQTAPSMNMFQGLALLLTGMGLAMGTWTAQAIFTRGYRTQEELASEPPILRRIDTISSWLWFAALLMIPGLILVALALMSSNLL